MKRLALFLLLFLLASPAKSQATHTVRSDTFQWGVRTLVISVNLFSWSPVFAGTADFAVVTAVWYGSDPPLAPTITQYGGMEIRGASPPGWSPSTSIATPIPSPVGLFIFSPWSYLASFSPYPGTPHWAQGFVVTTQAFNTQVDVALLPDDEDYSWIYALSFVVQGNGVSFLWGTLMEKF